MKDFRICRFLILTLALSVNLVEEVAAGQACPVFTSEMIDAAAMASNLSRNGSYNGTASYDPVWPNIRCEFQSASLSESFAIRINTGEEAGLASVYGIFSDPATSDLTHLASSGQLTSQAEVRACIAEALRSFVWNNFCYKFITPVN